MERVIESYDDTKSLMIFVNNDNEEEILAVLANMIMMILAWQRQ